MRVGCFKLKKFHRTMDINRKWGDILARKDWYIMDAAQSYSKEELVKYYSGIPDSELWEIEYILEVRPLKI